MQRSLLSKGSLAGILAACALIGAAEASSQEAVITAPLLGDRFVTLPPEANFPEGLAADPATGDLFVGTFDVQPDGSGSNYLLRYNKVGQLLAELPLGVIPVTGLAFNPRDRKVYFAQPAGLLGLDSVIQRVPVTFDASTALERVATIPNIGAPASRTETTLDGQQITIAFPDTTAAPNGLAFRASDGALFLTDSLQAAVFKINNPVVASNICPVTAACVQLVKQDPLLASAAFPQLGVNGLVLSADEGTLYLTNTGDDRLLSLRLSDNTLSVMAESLEGADGIQLGPDNTLIVSRALADEFAVIDPETGRIIAELGEFRGFRSDGSVRGFLFPGSFVIVNNVLFANNLALPLSRSPSEPEIDVKAYTLSRMVLPPLLRR
jgi:sugar lactone lactonase YvrE